MNIHKKAVIQKSSLDTIQPVCAAVQKGDFDAVATLFAALHEYNTSLNEKFALSDKWREILYERFVQSFDETCSLWALARVNELPIGLLILQSSAVSPFFPQSNQTELVALYVESAYRRTGVATQLMAYANHWSIAQGISHLQLYVSIQNMQARAFYHRCGWYPVQEIWQTEVVQTSVNLLSSE